MISPQFFYDTLASHSIDFYAGVPDSLLKNLCAYITDHADAAHNIIAANEGGAMGLAAGHYLATGQIPVENWNILCLRFVRWSVWESLP